MGRRLCACGHRCGPEVGWRTDAERTPVYRDCMGLLSLEHSQAGYRADFYLYGVAVAALTLSLLVWAPRGDVPSLLVCVVLGLVGWSATEYVLHRFVLHGLPPFRRWHQQHHARPTALVGTPTVLSAALFLMLVFLPAWWMRDLWQAQALMLGLLGGYLTYALTHHAVHHGKRTSPWLMRRRRWHARHHAASGAGTCFGVTSAVWDHLLRSGPRPPDPVLCRNAPQRTEPKEPST